MSYLNNLIHLRQPMTPILSFASIPNPYQSAHTRMLAPIGFTPDDYVGSIRGKLRTLFEHNHAGFTEPLSPEQQQVFTEDAQGFFTTAQSINYKANAPQLALLSILNQPFAAALTAAATAISVKRPRRNVRRYRHNKPGAITTPASWLAAWPWLDPQLQDALRPHCLSHWDPMSLFALSLVDPRVIALRRKALSAPKFADLQFLQDPTHPDFLQRILHYLERRFLYASELAMTPVDYMLIRWLSTTHLDRFFLDNKRHTVACWYALYAPAASPQLIQRAIQFAIWMHYRESRTPRQPPRGGPYLANLDLSCFISPGVKPSSVVSHIYEWTSLDPSILPRCHGLKSQPIRSLLTQEWNGPYADLARAVWHSEPRHRGTTPMGTPDQARYYQWLDYEQIDNPTTPATTLVHLLHPHEPFPTYFNELAQHPHCSAHLVHRLSRHEQPLARAAVAIHPLLTEVDRQRLEKDSDPLVKAAFLKVAVLTPAQERQYCSWPEAPIRKALADNPTLSKHGLAKLATDEDETVRLAVLAHPRCPPNILARFQYDRSPAVQQALAEHPACPSEILDALTRTSHAGIRYAIAANPNTSVETLVRLATSQSAELRKILLRNPKLPDIEKIRLSLQ